VGSYSHPSRVSHHFTSDQQAIQGFSEGRAKLLFQHWPPLVGHAIHAPHLHGWSARHAQGLGQFGIAASLLVGEGANLLVILIVFCHGRDYNINL